MHTNIEDFRNTGSHAKTIWCAACLATESIQFKKTNTVFLVQLVKQTNKTTILNQAFFQYLQVRLSLAAELYLYKLHPVSKIWDVGTVQQFKTRELHSAARISYFKVTDKHYAYMFFVILHAYNVWYMYH